MESKNPVYVISLDAVDLNLIPTIYKKSFDKVAPLWTKGNLDLRCNHYYEFEIKENEEDEEATKQEEDSKDENLPIQYVTCHICDIEVPTIFFKDHKNSFRHKFNTKIAEVALERLQKQIQVNNEVINEARNTTSYFCPECSIIIDSDNTDHNKSITHKNSVLLEKFLNDFLYFFTNETKDDLDKEESNKHVTQKPTISGLIKEKDKNTNIFKIDPNLEKEKINKVVTQKTINKNEAIIKVKEKKETLLESDGKVENKELKSAITVKTIKEIGAIVAAKENKINSFELDGKVEKEVLNKVIAQNTEIKGTLSKSKDASVDDLFESDMILVKDELNKALLKEAAKENSALTKSMSTKQYIDILNEKYNTKPMIFKAKDENFEIETIDGNIVKINSENFHGLIKVSRRGFECLMCKLFFKAKKLEEHLLSDAHMKLVSLPLKDKHCIRQINDIWNHCLICNIITENCDDHASSYTEHSHNLSIALKHGKLNENEKKMEITDFNVNNEVELNYRDITKGSFDNLEMNDNLYDKNDKHLKGIDNTKIKIRNEYIEQSDKYYCIYCHVTIGLKRAKKHQNTPKHIEKFKSTYYYLLTVLEDNQMLCKVCDIAIENTVASLEIHFLNFAHISNYHKLLNLNNIKNCDGNNLYCGICDTYIEFQNFLLHIKSEKHKIIDNIEADKTTEVAGVRENNENDISLCSKITKTANEKHENDSKINENKEAKASTSNCGISEKHYCQYCRVKIEIKRVEEHEKTVGHIEQFKLTYYYMLNYFLGETYCKVCETCIENNVTSIENHFSDIDHINNYDKLLNLNSLRNVEGNKLYCSVCNSYTSLTNELLHIASEEHKSNKNINDVVNKENVKMETSEAESDIDSEIDYCNYFCKICQVKVPNNEYNVQFHKAGKSHIRKLFKLLQKDDNYSIQVMENQIQSVKEIQYMIKTKGPGYVTCILCNIDLADNDKKIIKHVKGTKHVDKYLEMLIDNFLVIEDDNIYCYLCEVDIGRKGEFLHCLGKKHRKNVQLRDEGKFEVNDNQKHCLICNIITENSYIHTLCNIGHSQLLSIALMSDNLNENFNKNNIDVDQNKKCLYDEGIEKTKTVDENNSDANDNNKAIDTKVESETKLDDSNYYLCELCQVKVPNNDYNIKMHNDGRPHLRKMCKPKEKDKEDIQIENDKNPADVKKLHYQMVATKTPGVISCIVCDKDITNNEKNIFTHLSGAKHIEQYSEFTKSNFLNVLDDNVFCGVCLVNTGIRCEFSHCVGKRHKKNLLLIVAGAKAIDNNRRASLN